MANAPVQRMSQLMAKTLRDDPADAEVLSHKLLVRAGYVRRTAAGIWSWLPLGKKVLSNVERIVREEMDAIGAQEVLLPAILPREPYEATGRWEEYGPELFRLQDRRGGDRDLQGEVQIFAEPIIERSLRMRVLREQRFPGRSREELSDDEREELWRLGASE